MINFNAIDYICAAEPSPESGQQGILRFVQGGFTFKFDKNSTNL